MAGNDLEKWEFPKILGATVVVILAMIFGMPLIGNLFVAWDRWLTRVLGN